MLTFSAGSLFRSPSYLLKDRREDSCGVAVLRRVFAIKSTQLLQARQLQRVQVRGVILSQMPVSLKLQEEEIIRASKSNFVNNTFHQEKKKIISTIFGNLPEL